MKEVGDPIPLSAEGAEQGGAPDVGQAAGEQEVKPKRTRKKKVTAVGPDGQPIETADKPKREKRVKGPNEWTPDRPWQPLRGSLAGARLMPTGVEHKRTGKMGQFFSIITTSSTAEEALSRPAVLVKDGQEKQEYMDPGYIRAAEREGLVTIVQAVRPEPTQQPQPTQPPQAQSQPAA